MAEINNFDGTAQALFKGMSELLTTKTVVGEAVNINDTIILPLVDVTFGLGAGSRKDNAKNSSQGGAGVKMSPSAVLVIQNGSTKLVNIKNQDTVTKILDMVPDLVDKFTGKNDDKNEKAGMTDEEIIDAVTNDTQE